MTWGRLILWVLGGLVALWLLAIVLNRGLIPISRQLANGGSQAGGCLMNGGCLDDSKVDQPVTPRPSTARATPTPPPAASHVFEAVPAEINQPGVPVTLRWNVSGMRRYTIGWFDRLVRQDNYFSQSAEQGTIQALRTENVVYPARSVWYRLTYVDESGQMKEAWVSVTVNGVPPPPRPTSPGY